MALIVFHNLNAYAITNNMKKNKLKLETIRLSNVDESITVLIDGIDYAENYNHINDKGTEICFSFKVGEEGHYEAANQFGPEWKHVGFIDTKNFMDCHGGSYTDKDGEFYDWLYFEGENSQKVRDRFEDKDFAFIKTFVEINVKPMVDESNKEWFGIRRAREEKRLFSLNLYSGKFIDDHSDLKLTFEGKRRDDADSNWVKDVFEIDLGSRDYCTDGIYYKWEDKIGMVYAKDKQEWISLDVFYGNLETLKELFKAHVKLAEVMAEMKDYDETPDYDGGGFNGSYGDYLGLGDAAGNHDQWLNNSINSNR